MSDTEIHKMTEVHEDQFHDSYESLDDSNAASKECDSQTLNAAEVEQPSLQAAGERRDQQPLSQVKKDNVSVKSKAVSSVSSPKGVRRSQRSRKRRRADHLSRSLQGEYADEISFVEGLSQLEQTFDQRLTKLEQTFCKMMEAQSKQAEERETKNTTLLQNILKDFEAKITSKTTQLIDDKIEGKTAQLSQQIQTLTTDIAKIQQEIQQSNNSIDDKVKETHAELAAKINNMQPTEGATSDFASDIKAKIDTANNRLEELSSTMKSHDRKFEQLEYHSRKLNLVFDGVVLRDRESCKHAIEGIIHRNMRLDMRDAIDVAHTLGDRAEGKLLPIIVRFKSVTDRQRVLENSQHLRREGIYVRPDYPTTVNERRNYLAKSLAAAKSQDPRARLLRDRLQFKGQLYTVENIHEADIGDKNHTIYTPAQVRFYGYNSPFSNFHKASFKLHDVRYNCVEQALQAHRAYRNDDGATWSKIMNENNPVNMKRMGKQHRPTTEQQKTVDRNVMEDAVYAKFHQNPVLKQKLIDTQTRAFLECNPYDAYYSTGLKMTDQRLSKNEFPGANYMGAILERVRAKLNS